MKCCSFVKSLAGYVLLAAMNVLAIDVHRPDMVPRYSGAVPNEWTMDYQAAMNCAASNNLNTVVMFTAAWWCPYCQALDDKVLSQPEWLSYIAANPVMLVILDFNYRPVYGLPRDHAYNKCWLWDPDYLAANGLTEAGGDARLAYNYTLQDEYCTPSMFTKYGYSRVGYPTWMVLRADGTRAGRLKVSDFRDDAVTSADGAQILIRRYEQALLADPSDEMDDEALMSPAPLVISDEGASPAPVTATLSENDLADNYSFTSAPSVALSFALDAVTDLPSVPLVLSVLKSDGLTVLHQEVITPSAAALCVYQVPFEGSFYLMIAPESPLTNLVGYALSVTRTLRDEEQSLTRVYKYTASLSAAKARLTVVKLNCADETDLCYRYTTRRSLKGYLYFCGECSLQPNALLYFTDSDIACHVRGGAGSEFGFLNMIGKKNNKTEGVYYLNESFYGLDLLHGGFGTFKNGVVAGVSGSAAGTLAPPACRSTLCQDLVSVAYNCEGAEAYDRPDALFGSWSISYSPRDSQRAQSQSALLYFKEVLPKYIRYIAQDGMLIPRDEWLNER